MKSAMWQLLGLMVGAVVVTILVVLIIYSLSD